MFVVVITPILISLAAITSAAAVVVGPSSDEVEPLRLLHNATGATPRIGAIDPRFSVTYQQGQTRLSATSSLMNAANAMMELALENFTEPIALRNYVDPDYPEVIIVPMPSGLGHRVEARFLLWGVWEGIRWMINHRSFRALSILARWDGILMCTIWIRGPWGKLSAASMNDTLSLITRSENISIHDATAVSTQGLRKVDVEDPLNDQHLTVSVIHVGVGLGIVEVFVAIFAVLEYMAHFPGTDEVAAFQVSPDGGDITIGIVENTRAPGFIPPYLEYQWVILSMAQIPEYMLQQSRFSEVVIEISVNGVPLGEGSLFKNP